MIKLEIADKEFTIASSYEELSLGHYIDILKQSRSTERLSPTLADLKMIAILSDKPKECEESLTQLTLDEFKELTKHFEWVSNSDILESFKSKEQKNHFEIDGKKYSIHSNYNKLSLGEMVSYETLASQQQSDLDPLEIAFGVLLRPLDKNDKMVEFTEEVFQEVIKNKYKVNMMDVYGTIAFFLHGGQTSMKNNTKGFSIHKA